MRSSSDRPRRRIGQPRTVHAVHLLAAARTKRESSRACAGRRGEGRPQGTDPLGDVRARDRATGRCRGRVLLLRSTTMEMVDLGQAIARSSGPSRAMTVAGDRVRSRGSKQRAVDCGRATTADASRPAGAAAWRGHRRRCRHRRRNPSRRGDDQLTRLAPGALTPAGRAIVLEAARRFARRSTRQRRLADGGRGRARVVHGAANRARARDRRGRRGISGTRVSTGPVRSARRTRARAGRSGGNRPRRRGSPPAWRDRPVRRRRSSGGPDADRARSVTPLHSCGRPSCFQASPAISCRSPSSSAT